MTANSESISWQVSKIINSEMIEFQLNQWCSDNIICKDMYVNAHWVVGETKHFWHLNGSAPYSKSISNDILQYLIP